jgi:hypothetical protein
VLLVGGDGLGVLHLDTWRWNGETWTQVENIGPPARAEHAIAADSARARVVLFGGRSVSGVLSDTWEWDGDAWTQVADTGPSARNRHATAYDAARSRVVLFGGEGAASGLLNDTWEWDGEGWTQVTDTGPAARAGHAMCFESAAARTVLFGGSNTSDTWTWDGGEWTQVNDVGPEPRQGSALVSTGRTILFGGIDATSSVLFGGTWELEGADWTKRQDIGPTVRHGHALAYDGSRGRVVLFGGNAAPSATATASDLFADTWELSPGTVEPTPGTVPTLISFSIVPDTIPVGESFTIDLGLNQPASAATTVTINVDGTYAGDLVVDAGAAGLSYLVSGFPLTPGVHLFEAVLGGTALTASLTVL